MKEKDKMQKGVWLWQKRVLVPLLLIVFAGLGFIVTRDYEAPVIVPQALTVNYGDIVSIDQLATISDNRKGGISLRVDTLKCEDVTVEDDGHQLIFNKIGKNKIKLFAMDRAENESSQDITIEVIDTVAPVLNKTNYAATVEYGQPYSLSLKNYMHKDQLFVDAEDKTALDISFADNELDSKYQISDDKKSVEFNQLGEYHLQFSVEDEFKNKSDGSVTISVVDQTKPNFLNIKQEFSLSEKDSSSPDYLGAVQATDEIDGDLTSEIKVDDSNVQYGTPGKYQVTYTVSDKSQNITTVQKQVIIKDETPPVISLTTSSFKLTVDDEKPDYSKGISVSDNVEQDISAKLVVNDSQVNYAAPGSYEVIYSVIDAAGNQAESKATVSIQAKVEQKTDNSNTASASAGGTVLITRTGECYHTHKCGNGTYYEATLQEAQQRGLRPCKKCY